MNHPSEYRGRQVVVLGLAKSGSAVAKLFQACGATVVANDRKERSESPEADELEALGISVICGGHPDTLIHEGVSLLVKNPGIPYEAAPVQKALELGIEVVTEVEVAYHICAAPIIGVTGSNGKTTTTTWIGQMLEEAGMRPIVAGNIGRPLCDAAGEAAEDQWVVAELSSFQLKGTTAFKPRIACLLNISPTHLDYHGTMDDYVQSKAMLFANQTEQDCAILNADDEGCRALLPHIRAKLLPFSATQELACGVYVSPPLGGGTRTEQIEADEPQIVYADGSGSIEPILEVSKLGVPFRHNVENALAAAAAALAAGAGISAVRSTLTAFRGVEHRLEYVATKHEVAFYNNSKATNNTSTITALNAFDRKVILIAGGLDRKMGFDELEPYFRDKVKAIVTIGETREQLVDVAKKAGLIQAESVDTGNQAADTLRRAVELAYEWSSEGDIVLFSPACASWDMFTSYEERGSIFKQSVHNL